jgi:hypothetical protein
MATYANVLVKTFTFAVTPAMIAGAVAAGSLPGLQRTAVHYPTATAYSLPGYDRGDPPHPEPIGEVVHLANAESSSTVATTGVTYRAWVRGGGRASE